MTALRDNQRQALGAVLALVLMLPGVAARGDDAQAKLREQRRQKIEAMSQAERERLEHNFKVFTDLPVDQQKRLRQLDQDLRQNPDLRPVMDEYVRWFSTLSLGQRDDLRKETDPRRREELVRKFREEHEKSPQRQGPFARRGQFGPRGLNPTELAAVLEIIERAIKDAQVLNPRQLNELKSKEGLARQIFIYEVAYNRETAEKRNPPFGWATPEVLEEMTSKVGNKDIARWMTRVSPAERAPGFVWPIYQGLLSEFEQLKPTEADLDAFFVTLDGKQLDEVMKHPPDRQQMQLTRLYMEKHREKYPKFPDWPGGWLFRGGERQGFPPREGQRPPGEGRPDNPDQPRRQFQPKKPGERPEKQPRPQA